MKGHFLWNLNRGLSSVSKGHLKVGGRTGFVVRVYGKRGQTGLLIFATQGSMTTSSLCPPFAHLAFTEPLLQVSPQSHPAETQLKDGAFQNDKELTNNYSTE